MSRHLGRVFFLAAAVLLPFQLRAHDFWIEPSAYRLDPGSKLALRLRVGEHFQGEAVARNAQRIERFFLEGPQGQVQIVGADEADPAGQVQIEAPGLHIVGYRSRRAFIELEAAKFESYLEEEGLDHVLLLREQRGLSHMPGREAYSRCAKSIIVAGKGASGFDLRLGFPLELVPEANPYASRVGSDLPVLILYQGQPLAGALVVAIPAGAPQHRISARSDVEGRTVLRLEQPGPWLVKAVHMLPADRDTATADWESLWASLTFAVLAD